MANSLWFAPCGRFAVYGQSHLPESEAGHKPRAITAVLTGEGIALYETMSKRSIKIIKDLYEVFLISSANILSTVPYE
jgi:hypothetical protein